MFSFNLPLQFVNKSSKQEVLIVGQNTKPIDRRIGYLIILLTAGSCYPFTKLLNPLLGLVGLPKIPNTDEEVHEQKQIT